MTASIEHSRQRRDPTGALLDLLKQVGPFALLGFAGAVLLLLLLAKLSEEVYSRETTAFDDAVSLWVHGFANPVLDTVFNVLSAVGAAASVLALTIAGFVLLLRRKREHYAWRLMLVMLGALAINQTLK